MARQRLKKLKTEHIPMNASEGIPEVMPLSLDDMPKAKRYNWLGWLGLLVLVSCLSAIGYWLYAYLNTFATHAHTTPQNIFASVKSGLAGDPFLGKDSQNILFLGIDRVGQNRGNSLLTDTIIIININKSGQITLLPLPRDLWIDSLKTKINALYYYGEQSLDITGELLVKNTLEDITALTIDHTLMVDLNSVEKIIDILGGIDVTIDESFEDTQYPRDDVPPDTLPVSSRYKTVSFEKGRQHLNGARSLEFIRSRKSSNEHENTDEARSSRQQKVINALIGKAASQEVLENPQVVGQLYAVWHGDIDTSLSDSDLIAFTAKLFRKSMALRTIPIPVMTGEKQGIIYNPPIKKYNQWVYEPVDSTWGEFQEFIRRNLSD